MTTTVLGIADGRALGGLMRIVVTRPDRLTAARAAVDETVAAMDAAASRFRGDSELSRLNASPDRDVVVSPLLAKAIEAGLRGAALTGGAVDPTVGDAVRLAGYDRDFAALQLDGDEPLRLVAHAVPGWRAVTFDSSTRSVRLPRGVEIDLGATAKALTADLAATAALETAGGGVLISLGGDVAVAGAAPPGGWPIQVGEDSGAPIQKGEETISIATGGIATSSTTVRRWTRGGVELHHIIDPSNGLPAGGPWRTATVAAGSCVDANIASTAVIVLGARALAWLAGQGLPARLVDRSGDVHRVGGWPIAR